MKEVEDVAVIRLPPATGFLYPKDEQRYPYVPCGDDAGHLSRRVSHRYAATGSLRTRSIAGFVLPG